jgi:hypothetical protein
MTTLVATNAAAAKAYLMLGLLPAKAGESPAQYTVAPRDGLAGAAIRT